MFGSWECPGGFIPVSTVLLVEAEEQKEKKYQYSVSDVLDFFEIRLNEFYNLLCGDAMEGLRRFVKELDGESVETKKVASDLINNHFRCGYGI